MDTLARRAFKTGSWIFVAIFVGHTIGQFATDFGTPTQAAQLVYAGMAAAQGMAGSSHSILDFYRGNSYGAGLMFLFFGLLLLQIARIFDARNEAYPRPIIALGFIVALTFLLLSVRFFPAPPIIFLTLAATAFATAHIRTKPS